MIARRIGEVSLARCRYEWDNCHSSRKMILRNPPPIAHIHLAVHSVTFQVCLAHWLKPEVYLNWEMLQKELDGFQNIPVV